MSGEPDGAAAAARRPAVYDRADAVCVIGAGGSGLAAVKNLTEAGFRVDCYERETGVGGAWNWRHDRSPIYSSTHMLSSRPFTQFPDFPMPDDWPDFPHHTQVLSYFERYADHFGLRESIWFGTEVVRIAPAPDGEGRFGPKWDVTTRGSRGGSQRTMRYAAVVIANGHNWSPKMPDYEGLAEYRGDVIHAGQYKDAAQLRGRQVLVVGGGNSGCEIAVEAGQRATACWHSTRRGYWYAPKYLFGRPADQVNDRMQRLRLPLRLRQWLFSRTLRVVVGDLTRFKLRKPDHRPFETHPITNDQLLHQIGHGAVTPVADVARFDGHQVVLTDGKVLEPDLVILATGYLPRFDFLEPGLLGIDGSGRPGLALQLFAPAYPTLAVTGLLQPDSGIFTLAHWQSVLVARWLRQAEAAPDRAARFWSSVRSDVRRRYTKAKVADSTRHWFEVDHVVYLRALQKAFNRLEAP